ncbi:XshC-Cox1-family protein [Thermoanaerobacteraceae bacterium SP2]|nr:XshC-Cox1-family protein [Thermoanaerobacteraceae bacterium SP2]
MEGSLIKKLSQLLDEQQNIALVTITNSFGSCPRGVGAMMIVDSAGNLVDGTIGGGAVEEKAQQDAAECIRRGISKTISYVLDEKAEKESLPMMCGGRVDVFIQVFRRQDKLIIAGAGHIAEKLYKMAKILGYSVTILDDRQEMITKDKFPDADELLLGDIPSNLKMLSIDENTNIVIVTHGHKYDAMALETVINSPARYIGMIGSINKVKTCFEILKQKGISEEKLSQVYSPIGIDLGGETPEEISLAIIAEMQAVKYGKEVPSLKNKK